MIKQLDNPRGRPYTAIRCPQCGGIKSYVYDSRNHTRRNARRRRLQCVGCSYRYTTYEILAEEYEKMLTLQIDETEFESVIAQLRAIKVQFGDTNGHR